MEYENKVIDESVKGSALEIPTANNSDAKKLYLESYGCQMNFSDSEVVASILSDQGYQTTRNIDDADVILLNTCSIRENAEQRVRNRLTEFKIKKNCCIRGQKEERERVGRGKEEDKKRKDRGKEEERQGKGR